MIDDEEQSTNQEESNGKKLNVVGNNFASNAARDLNNFSKKATALTINFQAKRHLK